MKQNQETSWDSTLDPWISCNPSSPKAISKMLNNLDAAPRKRWGQNFLIDSAAQKRIIAAAAISAKQSVWEIGPGFGALTQHLWKKCKDLTLFEIDPVIIGFYQKYIESSTVCQLIAGDITKLWQAEWARQNTTPHLVIGNLPYSCASLILTEFATKHFRPSLMVMTLQKEMAERLVAVPSSKAYSSFSVCIQLQFEIRPLFKLQPQLFYPRPNIVSQTIALSPRKHSLSPRQFAFITWLSRSLFANRRKTIANNLKSCDPHIFEQYATNVGNIKKSLVANGIQLGQRAEEITLQQFIELAQQIPHSHEVGQ